MARVSQQQRSIRRATRRVRIIMLLVSLEVYDSCDPDAIEERTEEDASFFVSLLLLERSTLRTLTANRNLHMRRGFRDNKPSQPHPVGREASQTVSPGSPVGEYPPRKETPRSTHARRRPGEDAPSDKHELCDWKFTCPRRRPRGKTHASPSYPVRSPQTL